MLRVGMLGFILALFGIIGMPHGSVTVSKGGNVIFEGVFLGFLLIGVIVTILGYYLP